MVQVVDHIICGNSLEVCKILKAISEMLETVQEKIPQNICNGWKLQKFHELLHVSRDMFMSRRTQPY